MNVTYEQCKETCIQNNASIIGACIMTIRPNRSKSDPINNSIMKLKLDSQLSKLYLTF
jgi:hypothetical protein